MKVGDKVVCIDPIGRLKKNTEYTIQNIQQMACGCLVVDIGHCGDGALGAFCQEHCCTIDYYADIRLYSIKRFAPIQRNTDEFLNSDQINKVVEETIDAPIKEPATK